MVEAPSTLAPPSDPNLHSCGTVPPHGETVLAHPDDGFYLVGMKSYGRAPTFLPATGVCSSDLALEADGDSAAESCCTVPAGPQPVTLGARP